MTQSPHEKAHAEHMERVREGVVVDSDIEAVLHEIRHELLAEMQAMGQPP